MLPERPLRKESRSRKCGERDFEYDRRCVVCRESLALQSVIVRRIRHQGIHARASPRVFGRETYRTSKKTTIFEAALLGRGNMVWPS